MKRKQHSWREWTILLLRPARVWLLQCDWNFIKQGKQSVHVHKAFSFKFKTQYENLWRHSTRAFSSRLYPDYTLILSRKLSCYPYWALSISFSKPTSPSLCLFFTSYLHFSCKLIALYFNILLTQVYIFTGKYILFINLNIIIQKQFYSTFITYIVFYHTQACVCVNKGFACT